MAGQRLPSASHRRAQARDAERLRLARAQFAELLQRLSPLPSDVLDALSALLQPRRFEAGSWLLQGGEFAQHVFFVSEGLVRELYISDRGGEHTRAFVAEGQITGSLLDLISGHPAVTWVQALEPTYALALPYRAYEALCDRHPALERCTRRHTELLYVRKARREHDMLALSAGERYERWRNENPGLDTRIRRQHVASYLGITPEHLSRLRRR